MNWMIARSRRIAQADRFLEQARQFGIAPDGCLAAGVSPRLQQTLKCAALFYRASGLGILASRVSFFARRVEYYGDATNARDLWEKFDRLNPGSRARTEGGCS